jgi:hypothetical protein
VISRTRSAGDGDRGGQAGQGGGRGDGGEAEGDRGPDRGQPAEGGTRGQAALRSMTVCRSRTPYHSVRPLPAVPLVCMPASRAGSSTKSTQAGAVASRAGTACSSQPTGGRRPVRARRSSGPAVNRPGRRVGSAHRDRQQGDLVEGVRGRDELGHLRLRGEQQPVPVRLLQHDVGGRTANAASGRRPPGCPRTCRPRGSSRRSAPAPRHRIRAGRHPPVAESVEA